jgi:antiviral helicase SKI2
MVKHCTEQYKAELEHFQKFPFELSDFQKYAIEAITTNNDILITAHTGSGKTLPAEFAIEYLVGKGKKVIYTSPIKALSNQKFYEMGLKFPNISFGILTGDIKFNPEADVLIMTTEILRNTLLFKKSSNEKETSLLQFDMDIDNELGAVVFDEVHYINDPGRGKVWEETIMLLPPHIQLIMLSATIDNPEKFASWVENKVNNTKTMYLAPTNHRVVPLVHYSYITLSNSIIKFMEDKHKELYSTVKQYLNKPITIKDKTKNYNAEVIKQCRNIKEFLYYQKQRVSPKFVLNQLVSHLNNNNMLPAICFVFSRKMVETYAESIETCLFEEDSTVPSTIQHECRMILQRRISNYKEYLNLPEFQSIIKLLEKGIAIHHSGILPVLREMTELLFSKGYIKLLFATETFAVGLNMPTKTVIMTSFTKYNGSHMQYLYPHEYTQMAGRAGRRGIDTIGHVIHCNNLYDIPYDHDYSNILNGKPLPLVSKYETSMNTILTMINSKVATIENISELSSASLSSIDNEYQKQITLKNIASINEIIDNEKKSTKYQKLQNNSTILDEYLVMEKSLGSLRPNQFKKTKQKMEKLLQNEPDLKELIVYKQAIQMHNDNLQIQQKELQHLDEYFVNSIKHKIDFLQENNYIQNNNVSDEGNVARLLQEVPGLLFGKLLIKTNFLETLSPQHIIVLFSTINNIRVKEENRRLNHYHIKDENTKDLCNVLDILVDLNDTLLGSATSYSLIPYEEELNYDVLEYMLMWINIDDETSCRIMLEKMKQESEIFLGEFIKTVIKINNITEEMKKVAEYFQRIDYLNKLTLISSLLLKFVATNQSLYV